MQQLLQKKDKALELLEKSKSILQTIGSEVDITTLNRIMLNVKKDEVLLLVCGECKVGKSSLLTEIIGEDGVFPIDADVATNNVTIVRYGQKEKIYAFVEKFAPDSKQMQLDTIRITREQIPEYVTEQHNKNNFRRVKMIRIDAPIESLKNGLVLVDTPGVGGLDEDHANVTRAFIPQADAIIYASEASKPLDTYELEFVRDHIASQTQNVVFVLTKSDTVLPEVRNNIIETNTQKLAEYTGWPKEEIRIVPVSSLAMRNYRNSKKIWNYTASNFPKMEQLLNELTTSRRIKKMLIPNLNALKEILQTNGHLQVAKYNALISEDQEHINKLKKELQQSNEKKNSLMNKNASWRGQLTKELKELHNELTNFTKKSLRNAINILYEDTNIECIIKSNAHAQKYIHDFSDTLNNYLIELEDMSKRLSVAVFEKIQEELDKEITPLGIKQFESGVVAAGYNSNKMIKKSETLFNVSRSVVMSTSVGGAAASVLLTIGASAIAAPVGLAVVCGSSILAAKRALVSSRQNNNSVVYTTVRNMIDEAGAIMADYIKDVREELETYYTTEIEDYIKAETERYNNILKDLPAEIESSKKEIKEKAEKVKQTVAEIKQLIKETDEVCKEYAHLAAQIEKENQEKADKYQKLLEEMEKEEISKAIDPMDQENDEQVDNSNQANESGSGRLAKDLF